MKEVKAVIVPGKLETVHRALRALPGFPGMSVAKVEGYTGAPRSQHPASIREELTDHRHRMLLWMLVADEMAAPVHDVIVRAAGQGPGDATVWVSHTERVTEVHPAL